MMPPTSSTALHSTDDSQPSLDSEAQKEQPSMSASEGIHLVSIERFPEGGWRAWLTVFGAFLIQFTTFGYVNAFGVYQDFYVRHYLANYTPSDIGWIGGVQLFFNFSSGLFIGRAFDRGYFYHLIIAGACLNILALFMLSLSHEHAFYQVFLTNGIMLGLSSGFCYIPSLGISAHYFQRKRPLAMGIVSSGVALGGIVHSIILNKFFNGSVGFHNGVRFSAVINCVLLIVACSIMRTRLPPKSSQTFPVADWFNEPSYLFVFIGLCFISLGVYYPVFYLQLAATTHSVDANLAFYSLSILNAASVIGRVLPAALAPRFGVLNLAVVAITLSGVVIACMALVKDGLSTVLFAVAYGVFSGWGISLFPSVIALLSKHVSEFGTRIGICFLVQGLISLFASPIAGALLSDDFHWLRADLFSGLGLIVAGFLFACARYFLVGDKGTQIL